MNEFFNLVKCPGTKLPEALEIPEAATLRSHLDCQGFHSPPNLCWAGTHSLSLLMWIKDNVEDIIQIAVTWEDEKN